MADHATVLEKFGYPGTTHEDSAVYVPDVIPDLGTLALRDTLTDFVDDPRRPMPPLDKDILLDDAIAAVLPDGLTPVSIERLAIKAEISPEDLMTKNPEEISAQSTIINRAQIIYTRYFGFAVPRRFPVNNAIAKHKPEFIAPELVLLADDVRAVVPGDDATDLDMSALHDWLKQIYSSEDELARIALSQATPRWLEHALAPARRLGTDVEATIHNNLHWAGQSLASTRVICGAIALHELQFGTTAYKEVQLLS